MDASHGSAAEDANAVAVLEARDVSKVYRMGEVDVHALRGVSIRFYAAELIVLVGASGSGKSTLVNILGGLDAPSSGHIYYRDQDMTDAASWELTRYRRDHVGFVFQFYNLIPSLTARENVALVTEIAADPLDAADALAMVGLSDRLDHFPSQLSGGEQQRVAIARAVAKRPDVLLCDEPTGALDYRTGVKVLEVIESINKQLGTTTVVITHNAPISKMANRMVQMHDGQISQDEYNPHPVAARELTW